MFQLSVTCDQVAHSCLVANLVNIYTYNFDFTFPVKIMNIFFFIKKLCSTLNQNSALINYTLTDAVQYSPAEARELSVG